MSKSTHHPSTTRPASSSAIAPAASLTAKMCKVIGIDAKIPAHPVPPHRNPADRTHADRAHVLFLVDHLSELGDDQRAVLEMSRYLPPERFRATVITFHPRVHPAARQALGASLRVIPIRRAYDVSAFRGVRRLIAFIRTEQVQLVHTFLQQAEPWVSLVARLAGVRMVLSGRDTCNGPGGAGEGWATRLLRRCGLLSSVSFASLPEFARLQFAWPERGAKLKRATHPVSGLIEMPGSPADEPGTAAARLLARHGVPANAPVVLTMAHTLPWKGHTTFLHAAALVHRQLPEVHFVVAGAPSNPALVGRLQKTVTDLKLDGFFHFLGKVSDVHSLLGFSQIFCLLSEASDSPQAVLGAMSAGLPVVATNTGSLRSVVEEGTTGFLVEAGDAFSAADRLVRLLLRPELRDAMGAAAGERAHGESNEEDILGRLAGIYEELLASS